MGLQVCNVCYIQWSGPILDLLVGLKVKGNGQSDSSCRESVRKEVMSNNKKGIRKISINLVIV